MHTLNRHINSRFRQSTIDIIQNDKHTIVIETQGLKLQASHHLFFIYISPLFNQVGQLRTSSRLQLQPGQDKAKQCEQTTTQGHTWSKQLTSQ